MGVCRFFAQMLLLACVNVGKQFSRVCAPGVWAISSATKVRHGGLLLLWRVARLYDRTLHATLARRRHIEKGCVGSELDDGAADRQLRIISPFI